MTLLLRTTAALYRWRIARIDRRLKSLERLRMRSPGSHLGSRSIETEFHTLALARAVLQYRLSR